MRNALLVTLFLLGPLKCSSPSDEVVNDRPKFSDAEMQKIAAENPGMKAACLEKLKKSGSLGIFNDLACFEMMPARRWKGLLHWSLSGTNFCPAPAADCPSNANRGDIWLHGSIAPEGQELAWGVYQVEFIGRRTKVPGHLGPWLQYDHLMIVDRMILIGKLAEISEE